MMDRTRAVDVMFHSVTLYMKPAGEDLTMEKRLVGANLIKSRGLRVFVEEEAIEIFEGKWKNASGLFDNLEDAVMDALERANESDHRRDPIGATE